MSNLNSKNNIRSMSLHTSLYACGFNAHGQISRLEIDSDASPNPISHPSIQSRRDNDDDENDGENEHGKGTVETTVKVHGDLLRLQQVAGGGAYHRGGSCENGDASRGQSGGLDIRNRRANAVEVRLVFAGWSESAGASWL